MSVYDSYQGAHGAAVGFVKDVLGDADPTIERHCVTAADGQYVEILNATLRGDNPGAEIYYLEKYYSMRGHLVAGDVFYATRAAVPEPEAQSAKAVTKFNPAIVAAKDDATVFQRD